MIQQLNPLQFKHLSIWPPVIAAPIAGFTDRVFREILRESGCPYCVTEMVSSKGLVQGGQNTLFLLEHSRQDSPLAVQLFGEDPDYMFRAAELIRSFDFGFDAIDINMGCPARKIVSQGAGGALLKDLSRAAQIVQAVKSASRLPVSVKIRTGWTDSNSAVHIAQSICEAGTDLLVVHGRTVSQGYSGKSDWASVARIVSSVNVPVVGNGDIACPKEALDRIGSSGCAGVMVGRGILGNPFFFEQLLSIINGRESILPVDADKLRAAAIHLRRAAEEYGERKALKEMKKHFSFYLKGIKGAAKMRDAVNQSRSIDEIIAVLLPA